MIDENYFLTIRQHEIMDLVYKFRFINRVQIQKILRHKDHHRINIWLKDLVDHNYLGRIYSKSFFENNKPAIYYLANEGINYVRFNYFEDEPLKVKRFYQDKKASQRFREHSLALGDLYIQFLEIGKNRTEMFNFSTSTELWYNKELENIRPDSFIEMDSLKTNDDGLSFTGFFFELIEPYVPMYALRYKITKYIELRDETDYWDIYSFDMKTLKVYLVLPNQQKLNRIHKFIRKLIDEAFVEGIAFRLITQDQLLKEGLDHSRWVLIKN